MKNNKEFSIFEIFCIIAICIVNEIKLFSAQNFISTAGTGSIITVIFLSLIVLFFSYIISKLFKNFSNSDIIDVSEYLGGKILKFIIALIFIFFLISSICFSISNFSYLLKTIYFQKSPELFVILFFVLAMLFSNLIGINSLKKVCCLIIPFSLASFIFLFVNSVKDYTFYRLFPIFENNIKETFFIGLLNFSNFSFIIYFYFLMPFIKNKKNYSKVFKYSIILFAITALLMVISLLSRFPTFSNSDEINSLYMLTLSVEFTNFIQRVDALFILLWIISSFSYISILLFGIIEISNKLFCVENKKMLSLPYSSLILGISTFILKNNFNKLIQNTSYKIISIFITLILGFIILLLANLKKIRRQI